MIAMIKEVGQTVRLIEIEDELEALQAAVDGYIEVVPMPGTARIRIICDEQGKLKDKEPNFALPAYHDVIVGAVLFVADGGDGDFTDLIPSEIALIKDYLSSYME